MRIMPERKSPKSAWVTVEKYIQIGFTLPAATVVGWLGGLLLKRWLHWEWLPLVGLILGTVAGFVYFIRVAMSEDFKE